MGQLKVFIHPPKIVETCIRRCVYRVERFPDTFIKFGRWGAGLKMWPPPEQSLSIVTTDSVPCWQLLQAAAVATLERFVWAL